MDRGRRLVIVCDDDPALTRRTFETYFAEDLAARMRRQDRGSLPQLVVYGQVCRTLAELTNALEEADEDGARPDLVLIDDRLQSANGGAPVRSALKAVRMISSRFGAQRPKCVLHTSELALNDIWTFCAMGGHNAVDKHRPHERDKILWDTLRGVCWKAPEVRTEVTISDAPGRLLPYMELPYWKHNVRRDIPGLTDAAVDKAKGRLLAALELPRGAEGREIVQAANAHGLAWVPLAFRHQLPQEHPEHRAEAFRHSSPALSDP